MGQTCGKASWERLVGKTRGKNIDPLIHAADCVTLLLPLWRIEGKRPDDMTSLIERALRSYLDQVKAERQSSASNFSLTDW